MLHDQRFYVAVAFVLFFVFFGRKIWRVVASGLDSRAAQVRRDLDEAGALRVRPRRCLRMPRVAVKKRLPKPKH